MLSLQYAQQKLDVKSELHLAQVGRIHQRLKSRLIQRIRGSLKAMFNVNS